MAIKTCRDAYDDLSRCHFVFKFLYRLFVARANGDHLKANLSSASPHRCGNIRVNDRLFFIHAACFGRLSSDHKMSLFCHHRLHRFRLSTVERLLARAVHVLFRLVYDRRRPFCIAFFRTESARFHRAVDDDAERLFRFRHQLALRRHRFSSRLAVFKKTDRGDRMEEHPIRPNR